MKNRPQDNNQLLARVVGLEKVKAILGDIQVSILEPAEFHRRCIEMMVSQGNTRNLAEKKFISFGGNSQLSFTNFDQTGEINEIILNSFGINITDDPGIREVRILWTIATALGSNFKPRYEITPDEVIASLRLSPATFSHIIEMIFGNSPEHFSKLIEDRELPYRAPISHQELVKAVLVNPYRNSSNEFLASLEYLLENKPGREALFSTLGITEEDLSLLIERALIQHDIKFKRSGTQVAFEIANTSEYEIPHPLYHSLQHIWQDLFTINFFAQYRGIKPEDLHIQRRKDKLINKWLEIDEPHLTTLIYLINKHSYEGVENALNKLINEDPDIDASEQQIVITLFEIFYYLKDMSTEIAKFTLANMDKLFGAVPHGININALSHLYTIANLLKQNGFMSVAPSTFSTTPYVRHNISATDRILISIMNRSAQEHFNRYLDLVQQADRIATQK